MTDTLSATELRRWAAQCEAQAKDPLCSGADRDRLMRMRDSLMHLAENSDWLEGTRAATTRSAGCAVACPAAG